MRPGLGRVVHYVSRTNTYECSAIISATSATLNPVNVEAGYVPAITSKHGVHVTVFSPGPTSRPATEADFQVTSIHPVQTNQGGSYTEWDIAEDARGTAGTWHDPLHCPFGIGGGLPVGQT